MGQHLLTLQISIQLLFGPFSVFKNLITTDPLALQLVIDDLEEWVGKLEAVAENHQYEQQKVSMQIEQIFANQNSSNS